MNGLITSLILVTPLYFFIVLSIFKLKGAVDLSWWIVSATVWYPLVCFTIVVVVGALSAALDFESKK